jgi:drug/metabolite transporter (DMT)-like permease
VSAVEVAPPWLWAVFTVMAAAAQTIRNATQRGLTTTIGTAAATHVRFLFGLPFAIVFLAMVMIGRGAGLPHPDLAYWPWVIAGAATQIAATALMLAAMSDRSFVVVYAYIKTEPVQAALFGLVFLGDVVTPHFDCDCGSGEHGAQAWHIIRYEGHSAWACGGSHVRTFGRRLSRRDPEPAPD